MDWKKKWEQIAFTESNLMAQVGRISVVSSITNATMIEIEKDIVLKMNILKSDNLLDVCCGNGLLSSLLAKHCQSVTGVDFTEALIQTAQNNFGRAGVSFYWGDAFDLSALFENQKFDKILLYFSFQYFDSFEKGKKVISEMLKLLAPNGVIFIGDVPDYARYGNHYKTVLQRIRFHYVNLRGKNQIGKFWKESEMLKIEESLNLSIEIKKQPPHLPYSSYRQDYLLKPKQ